MWREKLNVMEENNNNNTMSHCCSQTFWKVSFFSSTDWLFFNFCWFNMTKNDWDLLLVLAYSTVHWWGTVTITCLLYFTREKRLIFSPFSLRSLVRSFVRSCILFWLVEASCWDERGRAVRGHLVVDQLTVVVAIHNWRGLIFAHYIVVVLSNRIVK